MSDRKIPSESIFDDTLKEVISQCTRFISNASLKKSVLDPLILYFKDRMSFFYITIFIVLVLLTVTNIVVLIMIYKYGNNIIKNLSQLSIQVSGTSI
jgi:hypothetical protein